MANYFGFWRIFLLSGMVFYIHDVFFGGYFALLGLTLVALSAFFWFFDIVQESTI
jgi:hypothetical protein